MPDIDLKAYTRKAKELEVTLYTHKTFMKESTPFVQDKKPTPPIKKQIHKPERPTYPDGFKTPLFLHLLTFPAIFGIIFAIVTTINGNDGFVLFVISVIPIALSIYSYFYGKAQDKECEERYEKRKLAYQKEYEIYEKKLNKIEDEYAEALKVYKQQLNDYENNLQSLIFKEDAVLNSLEEALEKWYDKNIIFPKYRNLIAITMINEYLESGRCSQLEGANGAYNLYEMELRQNIVIGQLSNIIGNLEQIRNNQYSLYEELTKSNRLVQDVVYELRELNSTAKLDAYFNYVTAVAETSPKIYHGITY